MPYSGGKNGSGVAQRLINLMPPHRIYIEPFLGGGAVMRLKRPVVLNIGIDLVAPSELPMLPGTRQNPPESARSERARAQTPESPIPAAPANSSDASSYASTPANSGDTARPRFNTGPVQTLRPIAGDGVLAAR
jgi:hypothetical protein